MNLELGVLIVESQVMRIKSRDPTVEFQFQKKPRLPEIESGVTRIEHGIILLEF